MSFFCFHLGTVLRSRLTRKCINNVKNKLAIGLGSFHSVKNRQCVTVLRSPLHRLQRYLAAILCVVSVVLSGCGDFTLATRSMTDTLPAVTIPGAPIPTELNLEIDLAIDGRLFEVEADSIFLTFARLRELQLVILSISDTDPLEDGAIDSFDFLQGIEVSIRARFDGVVNERLVAFLPDGDPQISAAARVLNLTTTSFDLLDFLQASGGYELVLSFSGSVPPDNIIISGLARYRIGVGI